MDLVQEWKNTEFARTEATAERLETAMHNPMQLFSGLKAQDEDIITRPLAESLAEGLAKHLQRRDAGYTVNLVTGRRFELTICYQGIKLARLSPCYKQAVFATPHVESAFECSRTTLRDKRLRGEDVTALVDQIKAGLAAQAYYIANYKKVASLRRRWQQRLKSLGYEVNAYALTPVSDAKSLLKYMTEAWERTQRECGLAA